MEFLIGLVVLLVIGVCVAGWAAIGLIAHGGRTRKKAEERAPEILDAAFDGRPDVVFKVNLETPSYETVLLGAKARGYRLEHETDDAPNGMAKTLIFSRA